LSKKRIKTTINGTAHELLVSPYMSLLDMLREELNLTGTKEGCLDGNCGACTVTLNGRIVDSCLVLAAEADGAMIETVEGIGSQRGLHPLQVTFLEEASLQCGICTPGFLVSAKNLLEKEPNASTERIRFWLAGNLCRCTGYDKIVNAVESAKDKLQQTPQNNGARK
jgi:carbon-monoxide dehydrogenase small subunit